MTFENTILPHDTNSIMNHFPIFQFENVVSCEFFNCKNYFTIANPSSSSNNNIPIKYLICESPGSPAFSHWVFEFLIPNYHLLKYIISEYPNMYWICFFGQRYIRNFLIFMGVRKSYIINASNENDHCTKLNNLKKIIFNRIPNIVFLPSLHSHNDTSVPEYIWHNIFQNNNLILRPSSKKTIPYLYLPRNNKDNYVQERNKILCHEFENWILMHKGTILDTYMLNNIDMQIEILNKSKIIILYSGSSFIVNGYFAKESIIIVIDEINIRGQVDIYTFYKAIHDHISKHNHIIYLNHLSEFFTYCFTI